jgi:hypothetical protein
MLYVMGGGLMQLVAIGAQDMHLTGNPQISFFKVVYRRHTNFSMESIEQSFNGTAKPGNRVTCTISRNGDLVSNIWLEITLPELAPADVGNVNYVNSIGHALIEYVELEIGGQRIDKHYGEWLDIWSELTLPEEKRNGFKEMVGRRDVGFQGDLESNKLYIPMQFFFCRNPGLALPLIALQYHEVKLNIKFRDSSHLLRKIVSGSTITSTIEFVETKLFVDYVYLDTEERQRFAQMSHEYLIEQLQHTGPESLKSDQVRLNFNHPVKELVWVVRGADSELLDFGHANRDAVGNTVTKITNTMYPVSMDANVGDYMDLGYSNTQTDQFTDAKLQLNGHDRFTTRDASYFRLIQPYQHHTRIPNKHIYCYSFALNPEAHQPSGTCNFSRLDNVTLYLKDLKTKNDANGGELLVYAVSNNILRITSGMGGLAYSN